MTAAMRSRRSSPGSIRSRAGKASAARSPTAAGGGDTEDEVARGGCGPPMGGAGRRAPEEAVIKEPKKVGRAIKWMVTENGEKKFRCFLPARGVGGRPLRGPCPPASSGLDQ